MVRPTHAKYKTINCIRWSLGAVLEYCIEHVFALSVRFVGSIVRIIVSIRMQIPKSPLARRVKYCMIVLGPCGPLLWAITAGVSLCDSLELHYAVTLNVPDSGACPTTGFKIILRLVAKRHDSLHVSMCGGTSCSMKCHVWDMTGYLPERQMQKSPICVGKTLKLKTQVSASDHLTCGEQKQTNALLS